MDKATLFLHAMKSGLYREKVWVLRAFSLVKEDPDSWKEYPYDYRIVQNPDGYFFVDPNNHHQLTKIDDGAVGKPLYRFMETLTITPEFVPTVKEPTEATYGGVLVNFTVLIHPFGSKIAFQKGEIGADKIEKLIIKRLVDQDTEDQYMEQVRQGKVKYDDATAPIGTTQYVKFGDAMMFLTNFAQICTPATTRKTMTASPEALAVRDRLLKEYAGKLDDPAVIAKISDEMVKADKEYMKGDRGADFLLKGKSYNVVRAKRFGMIGAQKGLGKSDFIAIHSSLADGWDVDDFTALNNTSRAGSFDRGAETQLGGESVKWLLRASSNMNVAMLDCGSTLGMPQTITEDRHNVLGFGVVTEKGTTVVTEENYGQYLGKRVMVRSPMFCKGELTDFCQMCVGPRLGATKEGLSLAVAQYGNTFMSLFLASMHGKALQLAEIDLDSDFF